MGRIAGKVAIVTGGASGLGEATCILFAQEGAKVVIADINEDAGRALQNKITEAGNTAVFIKLDVTKEEQWKKIFEETIKLYGKVNIVVNGAGISFTKDIEETTYEDWQLMMDVNATSVFMGTKYAIASMKDNGENCSIVNISSMEGQVAESIYFAYCAAKAAVCLLTKAAALTCGEKGYKIRVNSVHPGYIRTRMCEIDAEKSGLGEDYFKEALTKHPIGYLGKPIDIAYGNLYLASDESLFVTGSELNIDGGWTCQ